MQIGEVACKAGMSVRAVRYYEELGLVRPTATAAAVFVSTSRRTLNASTSSTS